MILAQTPLFPLFAVIVAVVVVVSALLVPLRVTAIGNPGNPYRIVLVWLFGAVRVPLRDGRRTGGRKRTRRGIRSADNKSPTKRGLQWWQRIPENPRAVITSIIRLANAALRAVRFSGRGELRFGLADPADTGVVWGCLASLAGFRLSDEVDIRLRPSFFGACLSFSGSASVQTVPFRVVMPILRFIVSSEGRTLIRTVRRQA